MSNGYIDLDGVGANAPSNAEIEAAATNIGVYNALSLNAFSPIKVACARGVSANIGIWGDSTGNEGGDGVSTIREWPYLLADALSSWLASNYPTHGVQIRAWNDGTLVYDAATVISTGSTSAVITIYNCSVAGSIAQYAMGSMWPASIQCIAFDSMIISHGHNHITAGLTSPVVQGEFVAAVEQFKLFKPGVPVSVTLQNPRRDDSLMDTAIAAWRAVASMRDVAIIDVYSLFTALGKSPTLYTDNQHPNQAGQALWETAVWHHFLTAATALTYARPSLFTNIIQPDINLLANGNLASFASSLPDSFTSTGAGTLTATKDTSILADNALGYSVSLTATGGSAGLAQSMSSGIYQALRGQSVTLAVKRRVLNTSASTVGRLQLSAGSPALGTQTVLSRSYVTRQTGWVWWVLSGFAVPSDATSLTVTLFHDTAGSPSADAVKFDQAIFLAGRLPQAAR
jgi:hypothetical protein